MGSLSTWHWLIVAVVIGMPALLLAVVVGALVWRLPRKGTAVPPRAAAASASTPEAGAEARLKQLQSLYEQGLVDDAEYARKRRQVLDEL